MGWWSIGEDDDVMGDDVADTLVQGLRAYEQLVGTKPSIQEVVDATADLLHRHGDRFLSNPASLADRPIEAVLEPPAPTVVSRDGSASGDLVLTLTPAFEDVAALYEGTEYRRKPRWTELLESLAFVLRWKPERLLRDAEGLNLVALRAGKG